MVGGFACLRIPFFRPAADLEPRKFGSENLNLLKMAWVDLRAQLQRRPHGSLAIGFDRPVLQLNSRCQVNTALAGKWRQFKWSRHFFPKTIPSLKSVTRSDHAFGRQ